MEEKGLGSYRKRVTIVYQGFDKKYAVTNILAEYSDAFTLVDLHIDNKQKTIASTYMIEGLKKEIGDLLGEFYKNKWCVSVKFE